jgi:hypothetical protein
MDYILKIFYNILAKIISYIPSGNIPEPAINAFDTIALYLSYANNYFAIDTLWDIFLAMLSIFGILLTIKISLWIYALIRGSG